MKTFPRRLVWKFKWQNKPTLQYEITCCSNEHPTTNIYRKKKPHEIKQSANQYSYYNTLVLSQSPSLPPFSLSLPPCILCFVLFLPVTWLSTQGWTKRGEAVTTGPSNGNLSDRKLDEGRNTITMRLYKLIA